MDSPAKFTLRFHNSATHQMLGLVADRFGMSKNQLAEEMLERELQAASLLLEHDLVGTLELLRGYRIGDRLQADIQAIAQAEAHGQDPLEGHRSEHVAAADAFGVGAMFAA
jgi:hypothetical protein